MKFYGGSTAYYGTSEAAAYFQGGGLSTLVPDVYTVAIGGRPYMVDLSQPFYRQYHRQLAPLVRNQADTSQLPGEQSMDPNGLWRRSFEDWSDGAGQRYLDRNTSADNAFYTSQGIDCLTNKWQISLLPATASQRSSVNTNLNVVTATAGGITYTYISDGQTLLFTSSLAGSVSWTTVTGTPAHTLSSLCSDGNTIYCAYGASGIYTTTAGTASATQYMTSGIGTTAVIGYCNGRLMLGNNSNGVGGDGKLYNIVASGTLPSALFAPGNSSAVWVGFANGNSFIYAAINIGGQAYVYGVGITSDGTSLDAPVIQLALENGETISAIFGYEGQLFIGTNLGVRYCTTSVSSVTMGSLIPTTAGGVQYFPATSTTSAVQAFCAYGPWVYFGWSNYAGASTGLGRIDLRTFVTPNVLPAYASDLMAATTGAVTGAANVAGTIIFAVSGAGFYVQSANLVSSGTISSGYILYDLIDTKIPALFDLQTVGPLTAGTIAATISIDGGVAQGIGIMATGQASPATFAISPTSGQRFEIMLTLNSNGTTRGPTVTRWTLRSYPAPFRPKTWQIPLILNEEVGYRSGGSEGFDPLVELEALETMAALGQPVVYQENTQSYQVFVQDVEFLPDALTEDSHYFNGIALVTLEGLPIPNANT